MTCGWAYAALGAGGLENMKCLAADLRGSGSLLRILTSGRIRPINWGMMVGTLVAFHRITIFSLPACTCLMLL